MGEKGLGRIIDRFRTNLDLAGIALSDADIGEVESLGILKQVAAFEDCVASFEPALLPDYTAGRPPGRPAGRPEERPEGRPARGQGGPAEEGAAVGAPSPIREAGRLLEEGSISPVDLVREALDRIDARDASLNAFQALRRSQAMAEARAAEQEIRGGRRRGPLHGIPVAVKDIFDLEGAETSAGSEILGGRAAESDSTAVARLRAAGAIIVGKTRMSEFAYSPGSNNDHFGATRNPRDPAMDSGGSSSGSAAAVAGDMVFAALGTDTGGSVRIPASFCGIAGFKPSYGRASLAGSAGLSWSLDHLGALARCAEDAALVVAACGGPDARDARTWGQAPLGKLARRRPGAIRLGVLPWEGRTGSPAEAEAAAAWASRVAWLAREGFELVEVELPELKAMRTINTAILAIEAAAWHRGFQRSRLADYGAFTRLRLLAGWAYGPADFARAQQGRAGIRRRFDALFEGIDILATPATSQTAAALGSVPRLTYTSPFNLLGLPAISIPAGASPEGLPYGIQLVGDFGEDALVLELAMLMESLGIGAAIR